MIPDAELRGHYTSFYNAFVRRVFLGSAARYKNATARPNKRIVDGRKKKDEVGKKPRFRSRISATGGISPKMEGTERR